MKKLAFLLLLLGTPALAQQPVGGSRLDIYEPSGGTHKFTLGPFPSSSTLSANRSCVPEDDSTPLDSCVSTPSGGDITDVWGCTTGNCSALTAASGDSLNAASADSTAACKVGTTAPATCAVGDCFFDSDATAGSNLFGCTATNTWTAEGGGSANALKRTIGAAGGECVRARGYGRHARLLH